MTKRLKKFGSEIVSRLYNVQNWYQLTVILQFFWFFLLCAVINKTHSDIKIPVNIYIFLIMGLVFTLIILFVYGKGIKKKNKERSSKSAKIDKGVVIIALVGTLCRLPMLTHIQLWDGAIYYSALQNGCINFDFTFSSVWQGFRLAGHYTLAYALFAATGEFLAPGEVIGVLFVTLIMSVIALICIYKMLCGYWCNMSRTSATLITLIISVVPVFWGIFSDINLDYFLLIFFVYLLYAEYKNWKIMRLFWLIAVMLTKETGWFIIAGYGMAYIVKLWKQAGSKKILDRLSYILKDSLIKSLFIGMIALGAYIIRQGSLFTWMNINERGLLSLAEPMIEAAEGQSFVWFLLPYLGHKIVQLFTLNFTWIPVVGIIVCLFQRIYVSKNRKEIRGLFSVTGAIIWFLLFSIFSTILFSSALSRYTIFSAVFLWLIAFILLYETLNIRFESRKEQIIIGVVGVLLCVQNFYYIDPVSNLLFDRLDSGRGIILSGEKNYDNYGDTLVNNYRYCYIVSLIDQMLKDVKYDTSTQIIVPYERDFLCIPGDNLQYTINWDTERAKRTFNQIIEENENLIPINQIMLNEIKESNGEQLSERAVVYFMPYIEWDEKNTIEELCAYYEVGERQEICNWGGSLVYYELECKNDK